MTSFDNNLDAAEIVQEVLKLLDEHYLYQFIDKCIEEATANFKFKRMTTMNHKDFIHVIGDFIFHIYKTGFWIRQIISIKQARAEAVALLEKYYQGPYSHGYATAFVGLLNSKLDGLEFILSQIAEIIKATTREKYIQWVYCSRIIPLDWSDRCQIAKILMNRWAPFLPPNIQQCSPAQIADHLPDLINVVHSADGKFRNVLYADFDLPLP
jgi:hypothetical protein